jgi:adenine deaminase
VNDPVDPDLRSRAMAAAQGHEPFDLLLAGGTVVDVVTGELRRADVGLVGPLIASVHPTASRTDSLDAIEVQDAALGIGLPEGGLTQPLLQCLAASLACLGGPHVTDVGLVDGRTGELVATMVVTG